MAAVARSAARLLPSIPRKHTWGQQMRIIFCVVSLLASISSAAFAGPKEDAQAVLAKWSQAFGESNVDAIVALYAPDALFLGTSSKSVVTKPEGIRSYFEAALLRDKPRSAALSSSETMVLSDTAVLITGLDATAGVRDGKPFSLPGRVTFIVAKRGPDWKIVHFHRSAIPN
jgi:uncharacterized protein (TIGR02246 family)